MNNKKILKEQLNFQAQNTHYAFIVPSDEGIALLREKGRKALIEALKNTHPQLFSHTEHWRFVDELTKTTNTNCTKEHLLTLHQQKILDPLWQTLEKINTNKIHLTGRIPLDLLYFANHFQNFPLVPGVVELRWIQEQAEKNFKHPLKLHTFKRLKFQTFLRPNDTFTLDLELKKEKKQLQFVLKNHQGICCQGSATYL